MNESVTRISIFDVDRTLTKLPTYCLFLLFAARRIAPWRMLLLPALAFRFVSYKLGMATRDRLKETMHGLLLGREITRSTAERIAGEFAGQLTESGIYEEA